MEYKGKMMEKEGELTKNIFEFAGALRAPVYYLKKIAGGKKMISKREAGENDFFGIYIPLNQFKKNIRFF